MYRPIGINPTRWIIALGYALILGVIAAVGYADGIHDAKAETETETVTAIAFCVKTEANLKAMRDIHVRWDKDAYVALMQDRDASCFDSGVNGTPVVTGKLVAYGEPFTTGGGSGCIVYKTFKDSEGPEMFTWTPSKACGQGI